MSYLREMAEQGYNPERIGPFHQHMVPWLLASAGIGKDEPVVDIGAGQGHCLIPLHERGWRRLTAVDVDDYNFAMFRERYGFETLRCDIGREPLALADGGVAAVLGFHLIEHLPAPDNLLREACRVLRPGGKLFLVTPDWRKQYKTFWRDPTHLRPFDKEAMARLYRMHRLTPEVHSWNPAYGMGRLQAYRWFPRLGMIGQELLAIGTR